MIDIPDIDLNNYDLDGPLPSGKKNRDPTYFHMLLCGIVLHTNDYFTEHDDAKPVLFSKRPGLKGTGLHSLSHGELLTAQHIYAMSINMRSADIEHWIHVRNQQRHAAKKPKDIEPATIDDSLLSNALDVAFYFDLTLCVEVDAADALLNKVFSSDA